MHVAGRDGERLGVSDVVAQEMGSASPLEVLVIATTTLVGVVLTLYLVFVWYKCFWRRRRERAELRRQAAAHAAEE